MYYYNKMVWAKDYFFHFGCDNTACGARYARWHTIRWITAGTSP